MNSLSNFKAFEPRKGFIGHWDRFIGPDASWSENLVALLPAFAFAVFITLVAVYQNAPWGVATYVLACFLAFDMVGGIATTATFAAKRWYHRQGQNRAQHMKFTVPHAAHLALFAWLFVDESAHFFAVFTSVLLLGSLVILSVSSRIQRSVAHVLVFIAIILGNESFGVDPIMQWFVPALFIKLFASYLPSELLLRNDK